MKKRITMTATALFALLLWPLASAACDGERGEPGERTRRHERMAEYLELTESQKLAIEDLMASRKEEVPARREAMKAFHEELKTAMEVEEPNATAIGELMLQKKAMHEEFRGEREELHNQILEILDDEQKTKFEAMQESHGGPFGGRTHSGPPFMRGRDHGQM